MKLVKVARQRETDAVRRILILSLLLCLFLPSSAAADRAQVTDRAGARGPLDVASATHAHKEGQLVHRMRTYEAWRRKSLRGYNRWIVFWISTNDDPRDPEGFERHIWIDYRRGRLRAVMLRPSGGLHATPDKRVATVRVRKPNRRTVVVRFPKRLLGRDVTNYRWYADTSWRSRRGPCAPEDHSGSPDNSHPFGQDGVCFDSSPELRHEL